MLSFLLLSRKSNSKTMLNQNKPNFRRNLKSNTLIQHNKNTSRPNQTSDNQEIQQIVRSGIIQPKLKVSQPNDPYEREADSVADQIMRMSISDVDHDADNISERNHLNNQIHRKCSSCQMKKEDELKISRKSVLHSSLETSDEISNQIINTSGGKPLGSSTKQFMESRFGHDFSDVRIHDDSKANELTEMVNARAFTTGNNIFMSKNESTDKHLLAHELTHVIQQVPPMSNNFQKVGKEYTKSLNRSMIFRNGRGGTRSGGRVLIDNNVIADIRATGGTRTAEMGVTGRLYTIRSVAREARNGRTAAERQQRTRLWNQMVTRFNITVLPDPPRSDRWYREALERGSSDVDARLIAVSKRNRIPLSTSDSRVARIAREMGLVVRQWRSRTTQPGSPRREAPPRPLREAPPTRSTTPRTTPPTTPRTATGGTTATTGVPDMRLPATGGPSARGTGIGAGLQIFFYGCKSCFKLF